MIVILGPSSNEYILKRVNIFVTFFFASLNDKTLPKRDIHLWENIGSEKSYFFSSSLTLVEEDAK